MHLATAPKSNAVIVGIDEAMADVRAGAVGAVPAHLRDGTQGAAKLGNAVGYRYPHVPEGGVLSQHHPDELVGRNYYRPTAHGIESARWPIGCPGSAAQLHGHRRRRCDTSASNCMVWYGQLVPVFHWLTTKNSRAQVEPGRM